MATKLMNRLSDEQKRELFMEYKLTGKIDYDKYGFSWGSGLSVDKCVKELAEEYSSEKDFDLQAYCKNAPFRNLNLPHDGNLFDLFLQSLRDFVLRMQDSTKSKDEIIEKQRKIIQDQLSQIAFYQAHEMAHTETKMSELIKIMEG